MSTPNVLWRPLFFLERHLRCDYRTDYRTVYSLRGSFIDFTPREDLAFSFTNFETVMFQSRSSLEDSSVLTTPLSGIKINDIMAL